MSEPITTIGRMRKAMRIMKAVYETPYEDGCQMEDSDPRKSGLKDAMDSLDKAIRVELEVIEDYRIEKRENPDWD